MTENRKAVPPEVIEALKRGDKQAAMKLLVAGRPIGSIKDVMQLLQSLQESGVLKEAQQVKASMTSAAAALPPEVVDALSKGNKIEAIRRLREATGAGLSEAKATIDSLEAAERMKAAPQAHGSRPSDQIMHQRSAPHVPTPAPTPMHPGLAPGEVPRTNAKAIGFVVLFVVAAIAVFLILR